MAKVDNLNIVDNNLISKVKKAYFTNPITKKETTIRRIYFNDILVWQNSNTYVVIPRIEDLDLSSLETDTIILTNFDKTKTFSGEYTKVDSHDELESFTGQQGQIVVEDTTEEDI